MYTSIREAYQVLLSRSSLDWNGGIYILRVASSIDYNSRFWFEVYIEDTALLETIHKT